MQTPQIGKQASHTSGVIGDLSGVFEQNDSTQPALKAERQAKIEAFWNGGDV